MNAKTDVFAFGVVLAELITGKRALFRDSKDANRMRSLISIVRPDSIESEVQSCMPCFFFFSTINLRKKLSLVCTFDHNQINMIFQEDDPASALEDVIDKNLQDSYPMEDVFKVSLIITLIMNEASYDMKVKMIMIMIIVRVILK